jgi:hypothetical protein
MLLLAGNGEGAQVVSPKKIALRADQVRRLSVTGRLLVVVVAQLPLRRFSPAPFSRALLPRPSPAPFSPSSLISLPFSDPNLLAEHSPLLGSFLDVLMLYAIKLGPIETGEGPTTAYVGFTEAGALPPVLASSDKDGLRKLPGEQ